MSCCVRKGQFACLAKNSIWSKSASQDSCRYDTSCLWTYSTPSTNIRIYEHFTWISPLNLVVFFLKEFRAVSIWNWMKVSWSEGFRNIPENEARNIQIIFAGNEGGTGSFSSFRDEIRSAGGLCTDRLQCASLFSCSRTNVNRMAPADVNRPLRCSTLRRWRRWLCPCLMSHVWHNIQ